MGSLPWGNLMNKEQIEYYKEMWNKNRLVALIDKENNLIGVVSYLFADKNLESFRNRESWTIVDDEKNGHIAYIDQLVMRKGISFHGSSFNIWNYLKKHFKSEHRNVDTLTWNRWKNNKLYHYTRRIKDGLHTSCAG